MKIVILDGNTVNPGDIDWKPLEKIGDITYYPRTNPEDVTKRSRGAEILIISKISMSREVIEQLPDLKYIGVIATGYNVVDTNFAKERGIIVTNVPDYSSDSVAQMVFAHILNFARRVEHYTEEARRGVWGNAEDFCYWNTPQIELSNKILGLVGLGAIGVKVARIAQAMGMNVIAFDPYSKGLPGVSLTDLDSVFKRSDFLSLHCPLTKETNYIINKNNLLKMKKNAFVINTGRGPLVKSDDLAEFLNNDVIAGAGLDVLEVEPPRDGNPLLRAKNCYFTPHLGWASREARIRLVQMVADNLQAFLDKRPINVVNR
ncbi:MAG: glycerate dehydrogenase [Bdellovibrionales bacterium RIFOXYB1_FULL_37_110]|nr:MAG: glycerate dehydrogenase [Bdellovibrionales bacterium RIFOXYC1_FULL_37_79]OFZ59513.1 MAG: glycerate dehydrogenase [Bdellovibrionales bacterium RIFOXYB1_FULL_37_110]OFZ64232.1 MAG: glycerate dehydrogenase [Bdellovibrionales bacterium RIFOXYD1_FULL_36_51]